MKGGGIIQTSFLWVVITSYLMESHQVYGLTKDYYKTLGIQKSSSEVDIKTAYRKLALQYHPDKNKDSGAVEKYKEIVEAYSVLRDQNKRKKYDENYFESDGGLWAWILSIPAMLAMTVYNIVGAIILVIIILVSIVVIPALGGLMVILFLVLMVLPTLGVVALMLLPIVIVVALLHWCLS